MSTKTDVVIVGAGPTGLTLATALATRGTRTAVIDRQAAGEIPPGPRWCMRAPWKVWRR